jgi:succinate-semialdehyde dehydrogenase/glutarate-semialdehyde dehydrogenase
MTGFTYASPRAGERDGPFAIPTGLLIGDRWTESASGARIDIVDPSTGETLTAVADGGNEEGIAAIEAAAGAAAGPRRRRANAPTSCSPASRR